MRITELSMAGSGNVQGLAVPGGLEQNKAAIQLENGVFGAPQTARPVGILPTDALFRVKNQNRVSNLCQENQGNFESSISPTRATVASPP